MAQFNLISSKQIIGELFSDFNIENDDWVNKAQRHIARAMGIMRVDGFYEIKYSNQEVKEFSSPLPCDLKYLITVLSESNGCTGRLPLTKSLSLGKDFSDLALHTHQQGSINFNSLRTNFETGKVMFIYYGLPVDEEGDLLIPNNSDVLEALPYFIIYKLSLSGYKHPVINMDTAYQMWNRLYPIARNSANYPSIEEMESFTTMNTNPLLVDIINKDWITGTQGSLDTVI